MKLLWCQKSLASVGALSEPNRNSVIGLQSSLSSDSNDNEHKTLFISTF
jgi:hypothetical protein